jgi:Flavodoxin domain
MKALVVFESMFGNTEAIARAIAAGLAESMDVEVFEVSQAAAPVTDAVDLIVVGGPTHAFSLSRPSTRAEAIDHGATHGEQNLGLREWLARLRRGPHSELVAVFDTRVERARRYPGSAAKRAAKVVHQLGYAPAGSQSFFVMDTPGPLLPGELTRAEAWGARLASDITVRASGSPVLQASTSRQRRHQ